jgi:hypothetical protein
MRPAMRIPLALGLAAVTLCIVALAGLRIDRLTAQFHADILAIAARQSLAEKASEATRLALSSEKNAMVMIGKPGLDDYATAWMTAVDHLRAAVASLELLADSPARTQKLEAIDDALSAYVTAGQKMYALKVANESASAIEISNGVADAARTRINDLVDGEVADAARDSTAVLRHYERRLDAVLGLVALGLGATAAAAAWLASRPVDRALPSLAGE